MLSVSSLQKSLAEVLLNLSSKVQAKEETIASIGSADMTQNQHQYQPQPQGRGRGGYSRGYSRGGYGRGRGDYQGRGTRGRDYNNGYQTQ